jgi:hypothetical protein
LDTSALNYTVEDVDDAALQVISEAWNYFPHSLLDDRCPIEIMIEKTRESVRDWRHRHGADRALLRCRATEPRSPLRGSRPMRVTIAAASIQCSSPGALGPAPAARAAPLCWRSYGCPIEPVSGPQSIPRPGCAVAMLTLLRLRCFSLYGMRPASFRMNSGVPLFAAVKVTRDAGGRSADLDRRDRARDYMAVGSGGNLALISPRETSVASGAMRQIVSYPRVLEPTPNPIRYETAIGR